MEQGGPLGQLPPWPLSLILADSEAKPVSLSHILLTLAIPVGTKILTFEMKILKLKMMMKRKKSCQLTGQSPISNYDLSFAVKSKNCVGNFPSNTDWNFFVKH